MKHIKKTEASINMFPKEEELKVNNGERCYYKGLALNNLQEIKENEFIRQIDEDIQMEMTFKPKTFLQDLPFEVESKYLSQRGTYILEGGEEERQQRKTKQEVDKMTDRLHKEKLTLNQKKKTLAEEIHKVECSFSPKINEKTKKKNPEKFVKRMNEWNQKLIEKKKILEPDFNKDKITGQKLFVPLIKDKIANALQRPDNIFEGLYQRAKDHQDFREKITDPDNLETIEIEKEKLEKALEIKGLKLKEKYNIGTIEERKENWQRKMEEKQRLLKEQKNEEELIAAEKGDIFNELDYGKKKQDKFVKNFNDNYSVRLPTQNIIKSNMEPSLCDKKVEKALTEIGPNAKNTFQSGAAKLLYNGIMMELDHEPVVHERGLSGNLDK